MVKKNFLIEICPKLQKKWKANKIHNQDVQITKNEVNGVTNKLSIFCNKNHNCFCDKRVGKDPNHGLVVRGKEV